MGLGFIGSLDSDSAFAPAALADSADIAVVSLGFWEIVTENPREIARERLLRRLPTTLSGKVARRFLIDVPIGNTKNAKTLQINKL